ncbi:MAG: aminopeptidase [Pseudomonadota bacterium]
MKLKYPLMVLAAVAIGLSAGCSNVRYYSQIVSGHMQIVIGKKPLAEVTRDDSIDKSLRRRINLAVQARDFAINELGLPDNKSYTSFYDTQRSHVTWNVVAAGEFSFRPKTWCFPVAGCVSYRGYYDVADAQKYAAVLNDEGLDVTINGATAYSTLGWFADPLLNTMLNRSDSGIVALLIHELAHQQLYVGNDSTFNESFAVFVDQAGLALWQSKNGSTEQHAELEQRRARQADFISLLSNARNDLDAIYSSGVEESVMRQQKAERFELLRADYENLKQSWGGYRGYDAWFARDLNNARLVSVATYNDYVPAFRALFEQSDRDFPTFYAAAKALAELPAEERTRRMQALLGNEAVVDSTDGQSL